MSLASPPVSVIVPAYGVGALLADALSSLQAQTWTDWEAIVVDDGSPDDVLAVFGDFAHDPRFRLLRTDNGGVSVARNRAAAAARSPFLAMLDGDDRYGPRYLETMLRTIRSDPGLGFVCCDALVFEAEAPPRRYSARYPLDGPVTLERVLDRSCNVFTAAVVRRAAFEEVGGFDPHLGTCEDLDLWIRLLAHGWSAQFVDEPLAGYRRRASSLSSSAPRLLASACKVYRKAAAELAGRPEAAVAERMLRRYEEGLRWSDGETLIADGQIKAGLARLSGAEGRSVRWRLAMALMQSAPALAPPLLRIRHWLPEPRRLAPTARRPSNDRARGPRPPRTE